MSIQAIAWALEQDVPDAASKLVLIALANAFNQRGGRCFPTIRQLMREASASERTVQRKIRVLADLGLIKIEETRDISGRQKANEYLLNMEWEGVSLTGGGCQADTGEGVTGDGGEGVSCDTPSKEPEEIPEEKSIGASAPIRSATTAKKQQKPKAPIVSPFFDKFWIAYPKREGSNPKKPAMEKFNRLVAGGRDPEAIIAAARRYARQHPTPTCYVAQAVTWLHQERFADDAPTSNVASFDEASWTKRLEYGRKNAAWYVGDWGPIPGSSGCAVPAHMLHDGDGVGWVNKSRDAA